MYAITTAEAAASEDIWWAFSALRLLGEAGALLAQAETAAGGLATDSAWRNEGVSARALRDVLAELHATVMREVAVVQAVRADLEGAVSG
ncbi:hypothetical protein [Microbacterium sp.]|uniref:hypothetical protein n=1 Tax=Microbacterium sp. TaxID=51671 RepID=UPI00281100DC|nr:hypothetical protein [Microbacterium sp.]